MRKHHVLIAAAAMLAAALPLLAADDDFEITLKVLDDVTDVDGVVLPIEEEAPPQDSAPSPTSPAAADRELERRDAADAERERENESEGLREDNDVPADPGVP